MLILSFFGIIFFIKLSINLYKWMLAKKYLRLYEDFLKSSGFNLAENEKNILKLVREAGIDDSYVTVFETTDIGFTTKATVSVFNNLKSKRKEFAQIFLGDLHTTIGVYKSRATETINPFYWLDLLVFLPKHFINYLEIKTTNIQVKGFQIFYWIGSLFIFVFEDEIRNALKSLILGIF